MADLELRRADANYQLVNDYSAWFFGELSEDTDEDGGFDDEGQSDGDDEEPEVSEVVMWRNVASTLLELIAFAASFGAVVGSAVAVMPWARWAACIGDGAWGLFVAVAQARHFQKDAPFVVTRFHRGLDGAVGLVTGDVQGAMFGIMAAAIVGAVLGGVAGIVLRRLVRGKRWPALRFFPKGALFAAACGVTAQAFYMDHAAATAGLWQGTLIGLTCGLLLCLAAFPMAFLTVRKA